LTQFQFEDLLSTPRRAERRLFEELARFLLITNLRFNFAAKRIIACAGFVEKGRALIASAFERGLASSSICFHLSGVIAFISDLYTLSSLQSRLVNQHQRLSIVRRSPDTLLRLPATSPVSAAARASPRCASGYRYEMGSQPR